MVLNFCDAGHHHYRGWRSPRSSEVLSRYSSTLCPLCRTYVGFVQNNNEHYENVFLPHKNTTEEIVWCTRVFTRTRKLKYTDTHKHTHTHTKTHTHTHTHTQAGLQTLDLASNPIIRLPPSLGLLNDSLQKIELFECVQLIEPPAPIVEAGHARLMVISKSIYIYVHT